MSWGSPARRTLSQVPPSEVAADGKNLTCQSVCPLTADWARQGTKQGPKEEFKMWHLIPWGRGDDL